MNNAEIGTCAFCRNVTEVNRQYLHAKNKPLVGDGFDFIRYCNDCGLLEYMAVPISEDCKKRTDGLTTEDLEKQKRYNEELKEKARLEEFNKDFAINDATSKLQ